MHEESCERRRMEQGGCHVPSPVVIARQICAVLLLAPRRHERAAGGGHLLLNFLSEVVNWAEGCTAASTRSSDLENWARALLAAATACTRPGYTWSAPAEQKNHTPNHVFTPECPKAAPFPLPARQGTHSPPLPHGTQVNADTANRDRPLALSPLLYPLLLLPASTH